MDWVQRIHQVMDYIEEHMRQELSEEAMAQLAACPFASLQSSFSQISGISLWEYIRKRRLTLAAYDLQNTDRRVTDIALDYGYRSADAFTVAFKQLHGVTPSQARNPGVKLTFYCRLYFEIHIKGVERMDYTIVEKPAFSLIGVRRVTPGGGGVWGMVKTDGSNEKVKALCGKAYDLGLCFGFLPDGSNDNMCAVEWTGSVPQGYDSYSYPAATWFVFQVRGKISHGVLGTVWQRINSEFLPQSKYQKAAATIEKYFDWDENKDYCHVEIWIPVELKKP